MLRDPFADTAFWIALVVKQDQYHSCAQAWAMQIEGRITTTSAVLLETANALARPNWRTHAVAMIDHLHQRPDVDVVPLSSDLFARGWNLYRNRSDKAWSFTDCISFVAMQDRGLMNALSADEHFQQAGFRPLLLDMP
jgi:predicted nucleic acid-binding protein